VFDFGHGYPQRVRHEQKERKSITAATEVWLLPFMTVGPQPSG